MGWQQVLQALERWGPLRAESSVKASWGRRDIPAYLRVSEQTALLGSRGVKGY